MASRGIMERYETLHEIGTNHYAAVWEAIDYQMDRRVAIMALHDRFLRDERRGARIWQDIKAMSDIADKNIVPVFDIVPDRGWVVMEMMRGSLGARLREHALAPDVARSVMRQILEGLQKIHQAGRCHGDVKPYNILFNDEGRVLLSFSPGLYLGGTVPMRQDDQKYQAPEVLKPTSFGEVGPGVDIYCLGFSMLELMKGPGFDDLFKGAGLDPQTAWMRWHGDPARKLPAAREVVPHIPSDLARVIDRMIQKRVADRFANVGEIQRELDEAPLELIAVDAADHPRKTSAATSAPQPAVRIETPAGSSPFRSEPSATPAYLANRPQRQTAVRDKAGKSAGKSARSAGGPKPWSREWINQKLENKAVLGVVIALILLPVVAIGAWRLRGTGDAREDKTQQEEVVQLDPQKQSPQPLPKADPKQDVVPKKSTVQTPVELDAQGGDGPGGSDSGTAMRKQNGDDQLQGAEVKPAIPETHVVTFRIRGTDDPQVSCRFDAQPLSIVDFRANVELPVKVPAGGSDVHELMIEAAGYEKYVRQYSHQELLESQNLSIRLQPMGPSRDDAAARYQQGLEDLQKGRFEQAIDQFTQALDIDPQYVEAFRDRGRAQAERRDFDGAIADFERALALREEGETYMHLGHALADSGKLDPALAAYSKAIEMVPGLVQAYTGSALVHLKKQEYEQAIKMCDGAIQADPNYVASYGLRGTAYEAMGQLSDAMKQYEAALEIKSDEPEVLVKRGILSWKLVARATSETESAELFRASIADLTRAIELRPDYAPAFNARGMSYFSSGKFGQAIADFDRAIELVPDYALAYYNRAMVHKGLGQRDKAQRDMAKAVELDPSLQNN